MLVMDELAGLVVLAAFLRGLRERAEEQRQLYQAKKRRELEELGETDQPPSA